MSKLSRVSAEAVFKLIQIGLDVGFEEYPAEFFNEEYLTGYIKDNSESEILNIYLTGYALGLGIEMEVMELDFPDEDALIEASVQLLKELHD